MTSSALQDDLFSDLQGIERRLERLERAQIPEAIRLVGTSGNPSFGTGWANYGGVYNSVGFYKHGGRVYLQGLARNSGGWGAGSLLFTLPAEYWPWAGTELLDAQRVSAVGRIDVFGRNHSDPALRGRVVEQIGYSGDGWVSLDGLSFRHV